MWGTVVCYSLTDNNRNKTSTHYNSSENWNNLVTAGSTKQLSTTTCLYPRYEKNIPEEIQLENILEVYIVNIHVAVTKHLNKYQTQW